MQDVAPRQTKPPDVERWAVDRYAILHLQIVGGTACGLDSVGRPRPGPVRFRCPVCLSEAGIDERETLMQSPDGGRHAPGIASPDRAPSGR